MPLLISPEGRISRNARLVGGQANHGLQPTGLSPAKTAAPWFHTVPSGGGPGGNPPGG